MKKALLVFALLFFSDISLSKDEIGTTTFEYTQNIHKKLMQLENLAPKNYVDSIDNYRNSLMKYFEHKKRVCRGEFSTIILSGEGKGVSKGPTHKLSRKERKLCFREMKALQITFINNMFIARKGYLEELHKKQIKALSDAREDSIKDLKRAFK